MREELLDAAEQIVQDRGLHAVSFQQLADIVGMSKTGVIHHFPNREALARALVDRCQTKYGPEYAAVVDAALTAPDKLKAIAAIFEAGLENDRLCLLSTIGHGLSSLSDPVRDDLQQAVDGAIARYASVFEQGAKEGSLHFQGSPHDAATAFLALLEGLQVLARARRDNATFHRAADAFIESLAT
jgi:TetR/AcrR family transcriptional repressor of nem operon